MLLMAFLLVLLIGFLAGCVVGVVLGHDIAVAQQERSQTTDLTVGAEMADEFPAV